MNIIYKYSFICALLLSQTFYGYAQIHIESSSDSTICIGQGMPLWANLFNTPNSTSSYGVNNIAYNPDSYIGSHSVSLHDDDQTPLTNIGFNFCYFGQTYNQFIIASNGWVGFSSNQPNSWSGALLPCNTGAAPKNAVMLPWQDLDPRWGGTISYDLLGVAPYRRLVVSYNQVPLYSPNNNGCGVSFTGQVKFFESTNIIETHILNKSICTAWNAGAATHGIHNATGSIAILKNNRNNTTWNTTNEATQFYPNGTNASTVTWSCNNVVVATGNNVVVYPTNNCKYVITAYYGCGQTLSITDTVSVTVSNMQISTAVQNQIDCYGNNTGSVIAYCNGQIGTVSYSWNSSPAQNTQQANQLSEGNYTVTITDAIGCVTTANILLTEPPKLEVNTSAIPPSCYYNEDGSIDINTKGGTPPYNFLWNNGITSEDLLKIKNGNYSLLVRDDKNCQLKNDFNLLTPEIVVNAGDDININFGSTAVLNGSVSPDNANYQYKWTSSKQIDNPSILKPNYLGVKPEILTLTVSDENGCSASDQVKTNISYNNDFPVYNAFSPNNDGKNDYFTLSQFKEFMTLKELRVYNRWGLQVFFCNNIEGAWDGRFNGQPQEVGAYMYEASIQDANGTDRILKGSVNLIR